MKLTLTTIAALLIGTAATAETLDLSAYNNGLTVNVQCTNVPARSGAVNGVFLQHAGGYLVEAAHADRATTDRIIGVLPAGVSSKDSGQLIAALMEAGLTNFELEIRPDRKRRTATEEVTTIAERGVATGPAPDRDNLTSMGRAASDGADILRVRSSAVQDVEIRRAGGDTFTVSVGAGDTLVTVPQGGTYIATFHGTGAKNTKATGGHTFNDMTTEEREQIIRTTRSGAWCR